MASTRDFKSAITSKDAELANLLAKDFREELDTRTHILDLSYEALKVNVYRGDKLSLSKVQAEAYDKVYSLLISEVRSSLSGRTFPSLPEVPKTILDSLPKKGVILIDGPVGIFIVGSSFDSIRNFVTNKISKNPKLRASRFGSSDTFIPKVDAKGRVIPDDYKKVTKSKLDIGHIASEESSNLTSPLEEKIQAILQQGISTSNSGVINAAKNALNDLYAIQANFAYTFKNTAPEAIEQAKSTLGSLYVVVTLHTSKKNNEFSKKEHQVYFKLMRDLADSIGLIDISGSNSIRQDIVQGLTNIILGEKRKLAKHNSKTIKTSKNITPKVSVSSSTLNIAIPAAVQTSQVNLSSLMAFINSNLQHVISANMGDGNDKKVLNYRTGRFAASAAVERLSESRQGMITAFYTYMKNPYSTFEPGNAQGHIKSRDPKLLISKSIREIAEQKVGNRLRSVLV